MANQTDHENDGLEATEKFVTGFMSVYMLPAPVPWCDPRESSGLPLKAGLFFVMAVAGGSVATAGQCHQIKFAMRYLPNQYVPLSNRGANF